jgi:glucose/mannose transport system permease protein
MKYRLKATAQHGVLYLVFILLALFYLFPLYTLINTSLKSNEEIIWGPVAPVKHIVWGSYRDAFYEIRRPILNTLIITSCATVLSSFLGAMSGYIFSKYRFTGSNLIFFMIAIGLYIAPQSILIPLVRFMGLIGLYNTYAGLILTHTGYGMPYTTLLFKNYYESIPNSLIESAKMDGCTTSRTFREIMLPLSMPGFAVVGIFQFTNIWNEYLFALTLTRGKQAQPATVAVANLVGTTVAAWNVQMAGAAMIVLPVLLVYVFLIRTIVKGLLLGSIKG